VSTEVESSDAEEDLDAPVRLMQIKIGIIQFAGIILASVLIEII
jgi:hypothetical protein